MKMQIVLLSQHKGSLVGGEAEGQKKTDEG